MKGFCAVSAFLVSGAFLYTSLGAHDEYAVLGVDGTFADVLDIEANDATRDPVLLEASPTVLPQDSLLEAINSELETAPTAVLVVPRHPELLEKMARKMREFRSTPYYKLTLPKERGETSSSWGPMDYRDFPLDPPRTQDDYEVDGGSRGSIEYLNAHAGNLLEHSKWTALQTAVWALQLSEGKGNATDSFWMEGVDVPLAVLGGFLHDVAKADDCAFSCVIRDPDHVNDIGANRLAPHLQKMAPPQTEKSSDDLHCYHDTYSQLKYNGQHDSNHPEFSARFVSSAVWAGQKNIQSEKFWFACPTEAEMKAMWSHKAENAAIRLSAEFGGGMDKASATVLANLASWRDKAAPLGAQPAEPLENQQKWVSATDMSATFMLNRYTLFKLTVALRMHWELGRLDIPGAVQLSTRDYIYKFAAVMNHESHAHEKGQNVKTGGRGRAAVFDPCRHAARIGDRPTEKTAIAEVRNLLKLTIAIAAADISGGSPSRDGARSGSETSLVTHATNAALELCKRAKSAPAKLELKIPKQAVQWVQNICDAGCTDDDAVDVNGGFCALEQVYPGKDLYTAFGFNKRGYGYRRDILNRFEAFANDTGGDSKTEKYSDWCKTDLESLSGNDIMLPEIDVMYECEQTWRHTTDEQRGRPSGELDCVEDLAKAIFLKPASPTLTEAFKNAHVHCTAEDVGYVELVHTEQKERLGCSHRTARYIKEAWEPEDAQFSVYVYPNPGSASTLQRGGVLFGTFGPTGSEQVITHVYEAVDDDPQDKTIHKMTFEALSPVLGEHYGAVRETLVVYGMGVTDPRFTDTYSRYVWIASTEIVGFPPKFRRGNRVYSGSAAGAFAFLRKVTRKAEAQKVEAEERRALMADAAIEAPQKLEAAKAAEAAKAEAAKAL